MNKNLKLKKKTKNLKWLCSALTLSDNLTLSTEINISLSLASLVAQRLKHLPGMRETRVRSLGQEDPLEKEMATHSNILAWRIRWTEESDWIRATGSQ